MTRGCIPSACPAATLAGLYTQERYQQKFLVLPNKGCVIYSALRYLLAFKARILTT